MTINYLFKNQHFRLRNFSCHPKYLGHELHSHLSYEHVPFSDIYFSSHPSSSKGLLVALLIAPARLPPALFLGAQARPYSAVPHAAPAFARLLAAAFLCAQSVAGFLALLHVSSCPTTRG